MANICAICGAEINVFQAQKLTDGNYICRKNCRSKGFRVFDYVHATLPAVRAHIAQVERGTKLWDHYFVPKLNEKDKEKKLARFGANIYVAADLGLMAYTQNDYKFFIFGKTTRACVYRIADLRDYAYEVKEVKNGETVEEKSFVHMFFVNTEGMYDFVEPITNRSTYNSLAKYFDTLFGIEKTLGNMMNNAEKQVNAAASVSAGFKAVLSGDENATQKAAEASAALDRAKYGDRTELIRKADEALAAIDG